jgi:ribosomal protein S18 acetylase RimI-like enzyme
LTGSRILRAVEIRPASERSNAELAAVFTAGYADYAFPIHLDEAGFSAMAAMSDFDLGRSRIAVADATPVGVCVLGVRGHEGWVGGLGVVPSARRQGLGRRLMDTVIDEARTAGLRRVSLEVLELNTPAIALYEQLGFESTRMLEVWSLSADAGSSSAEPASAGAAAEWIRHNRPSPEPWQRADESLENLRRAGTDLEAVVVPGRGAALFRVDGDVASVLQLAATDVEAAADLLAAVRGRGTGLRFVNVPEGDPAGDALRKLGGNLDVRQLEFALPLHT